MARIVWAILQSHTKRQLNERNYLLTFTTAPKPATPEEYRAKAARMYAAQNTKFHR